MTIKELYQALEALNVSKDRYYLHGLYGSISDDEKIALSVKKGKYTIEYEVYYKEKGQKTSLKIFTEENEACELIYKRLQIA